MGIEIERKFLVASDAWRAAAHAVVPMAQGYLNDAALAEALASSKPELVEVPVEPGMSLF